MNDLLTLIEKRQSIRAFTEQSVDAKQIFQILHSARFAPSGVNTQPWQVAVVTGHRKKELEDAIYEAFLDGQLPRPDYAYYPTEWFEPYKQRRYECGMALYEAIDVKKQDKTKRREAWARNYQFFGAPVGLFFLIDRRLEKGSWLDMGLFIQNVMLAATALDLGTCPQAALAEYPDIVRDYLDIDPEMSVVCGMALGHPDWNHPINQYRTARLDINKFTTWYDGFND